MAARSTARSSSVGLIFATALLSIAAAVVYLTHLRRQQENNNGTISKKKQASFVSKYVHDNDDDDDDGVPDPRLVAKFETACQEAKGVKKISQMEQLILYSIYKQSIEGDAPHNDKSSGFSINLKEKAKQSAWGKLRGMSKRQAMLHYIVAVDQLKQHGSMNTASAVDGIDMDMMDDLPLEGGLGNKPSTLASSEYEDEEDGKSLSLEQNFLFAASQNNVSELNRILALDPKVIDHRDEDGQSALHLAADKGGLEALNVLLKAGADENAADDDGITVLHAAVISENIEACRVLLDHGANADQVDVDGDTPRKCAEEDGSEELKKLFAGYKKKA